MSDSPKAKPVEASTAKQPAAKAEPKPEAKAEPRYESERVEAYEAEQAEAEVVVANHQDVPGRGEDVHPDDDRYAPGRRSAAWGPTQGDGQNPYGHPELDAQPSPNAEGKPQSEVEAGH